MLGIFPPDQNRTPRLANGPGVCQLFPDASRGILRCASNGSAIREFKEEMNAPATIDAPKAPEATDTSTPVHAEMVTSELRMES